MNRLELLKQRQKGIAGCDVGAIMGINKFKDSFEVYIEKTEKIIDVAKSSEAEYWGKTLEEVIAREFFLRTGKKVRRDNKFLIHKKYPFMVMNIDRRIVGENSILSCMALSGGLASDWDGENVPYSYQLQCQHYLEVTGAEICYLAVLINGKRCIFKEITRDEELINMIIEAERDFFDNHVLKGVPPLISNNKVDINLFLN